MNNYEKGLIMFFIFYDVFGVFLLILDIMRRINGIFTYSAEYILLLVLIFPFLNRNGNSMKENLKDPLIKGFLIIALVICLFFVIELIIG